MKPKIFALVGSHRMNGNSYWLVKKVLESTGVDHEIVQLADKKIQFCTLCEKCIEEDCVLEDDVNGILKKMLKADGFVFAVPKYLDAPSKYLAFLERLDTVVHMRRHLGYSGPPKNPDYALVPGEKPFCLFALSGRGKFSKKDLRTIVDYTESLGLRLVKHDLPPFIAVNVKAGDEKGEVLENQKAVNQCEDLVRKVVALAEKR
jgi:multimeric flavodoxin WrbA